MAVTLPWAQAPAALANQHRELREAVDAAEALFQELASRPDQVRAQHEPGLVHLRKELAEVGRAAAHAKAALAEAEAELRGELSDLHAPTLTAEAAVVS